VTGRLLTTRELADYLGLSTESVLRRWRRGEIPGGIRLASNVLRFRESEIDRWLTALERVDTVRTESDTPAQGE
jgi:excisionase family DNA binding protein